MTVEHIPNHTIDPVTGFVENSAYAHAFDAQKKVQFLDAYRNNGLGLYRTCRSMGMSVSTVHKHYRTDPVFKRMFDDSMTEYADELESVSRANAMNPRSVIERIFQLKALFPSKYGDSRGNSGSTNIQINLDGKALNIIGSRENVLDVSEIKNTAENGDDFGAMNGIDDERPLTNEAPTPMKP